MQAERLRKTFSEPNLIPLIDVALILVIIFMVLTPILVQSQLTVKLPKADSGEAADAAVTVNVTIAKNGAVVVDGTPVKWDNLERELTLKLGKGSTKTLLVQADHSVAVERVVAVLDAAKKLGVGKLGIGVTPNSEQAAQ